MKRLIKEGKYSLIETKRDNKILNLDNEKSFAWVRARGIGDILVDTNSKHEKGYTLSEGHYKIYEVRDDPQYIDLQHLELEIGDNKWQPFLLPRGLPDKKFKRHRIIPTDEKIS